MTWTRIDAEWTQNVHKADLSQSAELFHIRATVECNNALSDGLINTRGLRAVAVDFEEDYTILVGELIEKWGWQDLGGGVFQIPWDDQEKAEVVIKRRVAAAERQRKYREKGVEMRAARERGDGVTATTSLPSRPVPSRRDKGKGQGSGSSSPRSAAGAAPSSTPPQAQEFPDGIQMLPKPQWMIDMENGK